MAVRARYSLPQSPPLLTGPPSRSFLPVVAIRHIIEDFPNEPPPLTFTNAWTTPGKTTAAFSPQAGTYLLVIVAGNANSGSDASSTVTDTDAVNSPHTYSRLVHQSTGIAGTYGGVVEVWGRYVKAAPGSITVTVVGNSLTNAGGQIVTRCLLGADPIQPRNSNQSNLTTAGAIQVAITCGNGNRVYGAALKNATGGLTPRGSTQFDGEFNDTTNGFDYAAFNSINDTAGLDTFGFTTVHVGMIAAAEISAVLWFPPPSHRRVTPPPLVRRPRVTRIVPAPVAVTPAAFPFATIAQPRRLHGYYQRRAKTLDVVRAQVNPPYPWPPTQQSRHPVKGLPRRGRVTLVLPTVAAPTAPPYVPDAPRPRRRLLALRRAKFTAVPPVTDRPVDNALRHKFAAPSVRRGGVTDVPPPQFNPPYPWAPLAQPRRVRGWLLRRGKPHPFVPAQQVPVTGPPVILNAVQPRRLRGALLRRGRATFVVPPQLNPPYPWQIVGQPRRARGLLLRRGRPHSYVPAQVIVQPGGIPVVVAQQPRRLRGPRSRRVAPVSVPLEQAAVLPPGRARRPGAAARRARLTAVVRDQVNPPFVLPALHQPRQLVGLLLRRAKTLNLTRVQVNPPFPWTVICQPRRPRGWRQFRGHAHVRLFPGFVQTFTGLRIRVRGREGTLLAAEREASGTVLGRLGWRSGSGRAGNLAAGGEEAPTSVGGEEDGT